MSTADDPRDFYAICEACGRTGHDRVLPEWPTDKQCRSCLPLRMRVASRETAHVLDRWAKRRAEVERLRRERDEAKEHARLAKMIAARVQVERDEARAEVERLREALRAIAAGFDPITGSVDDPSAKQVDGYYRGYAMAALEKGGK